MCTSGFKWQCSYISKEKNVQSIFTFQYEEDRIMKKINMKHDNKDRIICVSDFGKHRFYYQPVGTRDRLWLFDTKNYSGSVFAFFRKYGRCLDGIGFSMTVKEMYEIGNNHNAKIAKILDRIPGQVEYVLRENEELIQMPCRAVHKNYQCSYAVDRAA